MNKTRLSIVLIALIVSSLVLFCTAPFGKAQSLVAPTVSASPSTVDQGQNSSLTSTAVTSGTSPYTYQWFAKAPSGSYAKVGTSSASYKFATSVSNATGSWSFILQVTDSTAAGVNSTAASVTLDPTLVAPTVTPTPVTVEQGQTSVLTSSSVTTGSGSYAYQWFAKAPNGSYATVGTNIASYNFVTSTSTATGSWNFILQVTDSTATTVNSTAASVTVDSALVAPTVSVSLGTVDQGQSSSLTSTAVTTGPSPYTYQWFQKEPSASSYSLISGATSSSYSFLTSSSTAAGSWSFMLQVTDSTGATMNSTEALVTVDSALVAPTVTPAPVKVNQGQTSVLSSSAMTTGSGGYMYQWFAKAPNGIYTTVGTNSATYYFVTSVSNSSGSWSFTLQVTDSTGAAVNSTATSVSVNAGGVLPPWLIDLVIVIVVIVVVLIIILFMWRRRARKISRKKEQPANVAVKVDKAEIVDNTLKLFVAKGRGKKQWVNVKEIPVSEITHIENSENQLSVTGKDVTYTFFTKEKIDLFSTLVGQVNAILEATLEDKQKTTEDEEKEDKTAIRQNELLGVINASVGIVDSAFNVLIGLQEKRINWQRLEGYSNSLRENLNFTAQTIPPMNLDFAKISSAVKSQTPKETSNEAFSVLEGVYAYFNGLNLGEDQKEAHPDVENAKALISAYFKLNDVFLGKVVGDKENGAEVSSLQGELQSLATVTNFKVNVEELKGNIDKMTLDSDKEKTIEGTRKIFKEQIKQLLKPNIEAPAVTESLPKNETITQEEPKNETNIEPTTKTEQAAAPAEEVAQPEPEASKSPATSPEAQESEAEEEVFLK